MSQILNKVIAAILVVISTSNFVAAQISLAESKINEIINNADGNIGAAVMDLQSMQVLKFNNDYCYPMQSVYKFPLALAVLNEVDKGKLSLDQKIRLTRENLHPDTWSPLRKKYPGGDAEISIAELLEYTVSQSDNNGCDILFGLLGGPAVVNDYVLSLGINNLSIVATEAEMHAEWSVQYENCSKPSAMLELLRKFDQDNIVTKQSKKFLWKVLAMNVSGSRRISGLLPEGTVVAHKTGTSGTNSDGITAATNDAGIVVLPDGKRYAIVVFVSDSPADADVRDKIIADISRAAWDTYFER